VNSRVRRLGHLLAVLLLTLLSRSSQLPGEETKAAIQPDLSRRSAARDSFYRRASFYLSRYHPDDLDQAIRLLNQVRKMDPDFTPALGVLAEARALRFLWGWDPDARSLQRSLREAEEASAAGKDLLETHLGRGISLMASDRYTPAMEELDRAVALDPSSFKAHLYRGMARRSLRRRELAREDATRALELDPSSPLAYALLGDIYQDLHDFPAAQQAYLRAAELDQHLLWPRLGLAAVYQKGADYTRAGKTYAATKKDFPEEIVWCQVLEASLFVATRDYEEALKIYQAIPNGGTLSPLLRRRVLQAGMAHSLEQLGRKEEAEFYWNQVLQEFPAEFDGGIRDRELASLAYEALIRSREEKGQAKGARELLEEGCRRLGMSFELYAKLADRQDHEGNLRGALATLGKALKEGPEDMDIVSVTETSLPYLRRAASGKPQAAPVRLAEALVHEMAIRVAASSPASYVPYLNLGRAEALLGHPAEAVGHLRQAVDRGYPGTRLISSDRDLKSLLGQPGLEELTQTP
jgi:tetratricopeptide (TPR) repeat protein